MATYEEYLEHAKSKNFQPVKEGTFNSLTKAGFDPIKNTFEKEQIRKMGDALDKAGVPLPRPDTFPKTTAAFEAMAKSDAERAERRAARGAASSLDEFNAKTAKGGGGGGGGIPKAGLKKPLDMKSGGKVSSASKRADGCAIRGKTKA
jgi:hypothetical protein